MKAKIPPGHAIVDRMDDLERDNSDREIRLTICAVSDEGTHPLNGTWKWDGPTFQPVGMTIRVWAGSYSVHTLLNGKEVHSSNPEEYFSAAKAIRTMDSRMEDMRETRGNPADVADKVGRWLEACKVGTVWMRPGGQPQRGWMTEGKWLRLSVGETVTLIRDKSAKAIADCAAADAAQRA
jgi:hypothetical protein